MPFTPDEERDLPHIISTPRFATYLQAAHHDVRLALELYQWNLELSSAFIIPLQVCEVAARNGVVLALESLYGQDWHLSTGFVQSLPQAQRGYCARQDFIRTVALLKRSDVLTAGKVVADLKFAFWEYMLTMRHDQRLWVPYFAQAFPHADHTIPVYQARGIAHSHLERIRGLRNRIAHHEPIFRRNITEEYDCILNVIRWRSPTSADWIGKIEAVSEVNSRKPIP